MQRETWTPWIGIQDIVAYLVQRAHWGALCWGVFLGLILLFDAARHPFSVGSDKFLLFAAVVGGVALAQVMAGGLSQTHQWAGWLPHVLTSALLIGYMVAMTLLVHLALPFHPTVLKWILGCASLGVLFRGTGIASWKYRT